MKPTAILFDLDGTLLPMDLDLFLKDYFERLAAHMAKKGYDPKGLVNAVWQGMRAMVANDDGTKTNEARFWDSFALELGIEARDEEPYLELFYKTEFDKIAPTCGRLDDAGEVIKKLKSMGYRIILATNPIFPRIATEKRIAWAGLHVDDFELITTYENSHYTKPSLGYYREILASQGLTPEECIMVGNDVGEDMIAAELGLDVFLLPKCLINRKNLDISPYPQGELKDLIAYLEAK
jgi:FMN phosphatase YigB (HAD superfamily)